MADRTYRGQPGTDRAGPVCVSQFSSASSVRLDLCGDHAAEWNGTHLIYRARANRRFGALRAPGAGLLFLAPAALDFDLSGYALARHTSAKTGHTIAWSGSASSGLRTGSGPGFARPRRRSDAARWCPPARSEERRVGKE